MAEPNARMSSRSTTHRPVLVLHTAVTYVASQGLGIGLVERLASAKTGQTLGAMMGRKLKSRGFKVPKEPIASGRIDADQRADLLALLEALKLANSRVEFLWPEDIPKTTVLILLGRPCDEVVSMVKHHLEYEPESLRTVKGPNRTTLKAIIQKIHSIRRKGFKVSITMSDHHESKVQMMAAKEAEKRYRRVLNNLARKISEETSRSVAPKAQRSQ